MKLQRTFHFHTPLFGILPLANVLFLVLVFYVMGSRFILQPGVQVALPVTSFALGPQRGAQIVSITSAPASAIYYRDQKVTFDELHSQLAGRPAMDRSLIIKADKSAPAGLLSDVMNDALCHGYSVILAGEIPPPAVEKQQP